MSVYIQMRPPLQSPVSPSSPSPPRLRPITNHGPTTASRQTQKQRQHPRETRRAQPRDGIPARRGLEPRRPTPPIATARDIVEDIRMRVQGRIDEPDGTFPKIESRLIDERDDGAKDGRRGRGAVDERELAVDGDDIVRAVGRNVGNAFRLLGVVEAVGAVRGRMVAEEGLHGRGLVVREGEDVGEAAAGVDDCFARFFGRGDGGAWSDLRGADGGDVGAAAGEGRVEDAGGAVVVPFRDRVDAAAAVAGDAVVSGGVDDCDALQAEFHVFLALAHLVGWGQVGLLGMSVLTLKNVWGETRYFVVPIGGADHVGGSVATAVLRPLVTTTSGIGIGGVLCWVVPTLKGAVRSVNGVEEVVEGCTLDQVTDLVESYLLGVDE